MKKLFIAPAIIRYTDYGTPCGSARGVWWMTADHEPIPGGFEEGKTIKMKRAAFEANGGPAAGWELVVLPTYVCTVDMNPRGTI